MCDYKGWQGKILIVDLTAGTLSERPLSKEEMKDYLGGGGTNTKLLYEFAPPDVDPMSPDNALIIGAGPLVGTPIPASGRFTMTTKSPLSGIFADSNAGGNFGVVMKRCGYDHVVLLGKASSPVYLLMTEDKAEILPADDLWGMDIIETNDALLEKHGKEAEVARIGQAGENLVKFACVITSSKRLGVFGRTGVGAVMGSKNLKAIVVDGHKEIPLADPSSVDIIAKHLQEKMTSSLPCKDRARNGTLNVITGYNAVNELWKQNHRELAGEEEGMQLEPDVFLEHYYKGKRGCYRCPLACTLRWEIPEGKFAGETGDKVEFGHIFPIGVNLGIFDYPSILHISNLTNRYGVDSVELGYTLSMASECYELGILTLERTEGTPILWGDSDSYETVIEQIVFRRGIGDVLAEGTKRAAELIGPEAIPYGLHMKGLGYGPENSAGWTLGLLTSSRGGDHLKAMPISLYAFGMPHMMDAMIGAKADQPEAYQMDSPVGKGRYIWWHENYKVLVDSLGLCIFPYLMLVMGAGDCLPEELNVFLSCVTGLTLNEEEFMNAAERVYQLQKLYNVELGIKRKDDELNKRPVDKQWESSSPFVQLDTSHPGMLDEYYDYRGYNRDGLPTPQRLREVGLDDYLHRLDKLGLMAREL